MLRGRLDTSELQGGATLQLRKERALAHLIPHTGVLQGGLDFSVAEGCNAVWRSAWHSSLQWGRDFSVAEGDRVLAPPQPAIRASMGPQLDSCGRDQHAQRPQHDPHASMGPQLDSCGRYSKMSDFNEGITLQWGRNLTVAEGARRSGRTCRAPGMLQWGRNLTVAEGAPTAPPALPRALLQWGRNLTVAEGRRDPTAPGAAAELQWGRNLTVAEGSGTRSTIVSTRRFNGAAT